MSNTSRTFSMELFPPKTEAGMATMRHAVNKLATLQPAYFSVTFGAGGSSQDRTFTTVDWLRENSIVAVPHISCIGANRDEIRSILQRYQAQGITHIVALRGDLPAGVNLESSDLRYANELVSFIREAFSDDFSIEVAAYPEFHPEAESPDADFTNFKRKVLAGADGAITQYFYSLDAYLQFVDKCRQQGIDIPVVPGIMPITNYTSLARFSDACGAEIPRWIRKQLEAWGDDLDSIQAFGKDVVTQLCDQLLEAGAPGLHFYTMNRADPVVSIWQDLGLKNNA